MADRATQCAQCDGTGWVCENCRTAWEKSGGETCCGAGMPCECNPSAHYEFAAVIAAVDPRNVKEWTQ